MDSKIELLPYTGTRFDGKITTWDQDRVVVDGKTVGYLPHAKGPTTILPILPLSDADWQTVADECSKIRKCDIAWQKFPELPKPPKDEVEEEEYTE